MQGNPDSSLLTKKINARDGGALEELFGLYYRPLCYFAEGMVKDPETAKDVVQEVFIRFWESAPTFPGPQALRSFLYTSVQNRSLNHIEKHNNRRRIRKSLETDSWSENDFLLRQVETDVMQAISSAVDTLPAQCREVFIMSYVDECDIRHVAERLGIAETTVKTQRRRAKQMLRERLAAYAGKLPFGKK